MSTPADPFAALMTEAQFLTLVIDTAGLRGWRVYHTHDSRRSPGGFPDLVLARRGRVVFIELKTEAGRMSKLQTEWIDELLGPPEGMGAEVYVFRPSDWQAICHVLA